MTPDPRLAALRALAEKATPHEDWNLDPEPRPYVNLAGAVCMSPAVVISLLDALRSAEDRLAAAEGEIERRFPHDEHYEQLNDALGQRDALAARLAGAMRVVNAVKARLHVWQDAETYDALEAFDALSEAGGEGRGTV